jgi:hypothetical protein
MLEMTLRVNPTGERGIPRTEIQNSRIRNSKQKKSTLEESNDSATIPGVRKSIPAVDLHEPTRVVAYRIRFLTVDS